MFSITRVPRQLISRFYVRECFSIYLGPPTCVMFERAISTLFLPSALLTNSLFDGTQNIYDVHGTFGKRNFRTFARNVPVKFTFRLLSLELETPSRLQTNVILVGDRAFVVHIHERATIFAINSTIAGQNKNNRVNA